MLIPMCRYNTYTHKTFDPAERGNFCLSLAVSDRFGKICWLSTIYFFLHINEQIIFFPHSIEQTIFFCQFREQIIFLRKNHTPLSLVLNGRPLSDPSSSVEVRSKKMTDILHYGFFQIAISIILIMFFIDLLKNNDSSPDSM